MKCSDIIAQDHAALRRGLNILDRMVQRMEEGNLIEIFDIRTMLKFLRIFGDEYHQSMEEHVLFPVLLRAAPEEVERHEMFLLEHAEERELLSAIDAALNPKHGIGFVQSSRRLILLLRNHLEKEERALEDISERLLPKDEDEVIAALFASNRPMPDIFASFSRLERKYAAKPRAIPAELDRRAHA